MSNCGGTPLVCVTCPPCPAKHYKKGKGKKSGGGCSTRKKYICFDASPNNNNNNNNSNNTNSSNNCNSNSNGGSEKKKSFMDDIWKVMTPEMTQKLIDILVEDFHLSKPEATDFIKEQKESNKNNQKGKCPCLDSGGSSLPSMEIRNLMVKEFTEMVAWKFSDYIAMMICSRKTKRQGMLAETMHESMKGFVGDSGDSQLGKIIEIVADRLAMWLDSLFEEPPTREVKKDDKK